MASIAGVASEAGNVMGLMPHPEEACDPLLGSTDGRALIEGLLGVSDEPLHRQLGLTDDEFDRRIVGAARGASPPSRSS